MFNVFTIVPTYDDRDAINGSRAFVAPYTYLTLQGAQAKARLLARDEDDLNYYVVRPVGASPFDRSLEASVATHAVLDGDIPF